MATLRVTNLRGRSGTESPTLPDGAVISGITTVTTLQATTITATTYNGIPPSFNELDATLFG